LDYNVKKTDVMSGEAWHNSVRTEHGQRQGWHVRWPREYGACQAL